MIVLSLFIYPANALSAEVIVQIKEKSKNVFKTLTRKSLTKEEAAEFYKVHQARPFYDDLCTYLSSGPIFVLILKGEGAVALNRKLMGATNPKDAEPETSEPQEFDTLQRYKLPFIAIVIPVSVNDEVVAFEYIPPFKTVLQFPPPFVLSSQK